MVEYEPGEYFGSAALNYIKRQSEGYGVHSGLEVSGSTASLGVVVNTGTAFIGYGGTSSFSYVTTEVTLSLNANDSYPMKAAIYMDFVGNVTSTYGTASQEIPTGAVGREAQYPFEPNIGASSTLLAEVWIPAAETTSSNLIIYNVDKISWPRKENSDYATVSSGSNSITIGHDLSVTPTMVYIMGDHTDTSAWFISDRTTASFTINFPITGTTDLRTISWIANAI